MAFDSTEYKNEFAKANYDRVAFNVPKGKKAELKKKAEKKGMSINAYIIEAIEQYHKIDLTTK